MSDGGDEGGGGGGKRGGGGRNSLMRGFSISAPPQKGSSSPFVGVALRAGLAYSARFIADHAATIVLPDEIGRREKSASRKKYRTTQ